MDMVLVTMLYRTRLASRNDGNSDYKECRQKETRPESTFAILITINMILFHVTSNEIDIWIDGSHVLPLTPFPA